MQTNTELILGTEPITNQYSNTTFTWKQCKRKVAVPILNRSRKSNSYFYEWMMKRHLQSALCTSAFYTSCLQKVQITSAVYQLSHPHVTRSRLRFVSAIENVICSPCLVFIRTLLIVSFLLLCPQKTRPPFLYIYPTKNLLLMIKYEQSTSCRNCFPS